MKTFKRQRQPLARKVLGVEETQIEALERDNAVLVQALREIRSAANGRTHNKAYIARLVDEAFSEIGY